MRGRHPTPPLKRFLWHPLQAALLGLIYALVSLLPVDAASAFGGWVGRELGPRLGITRRAARRLALRLPQADPDATMRAMWDNLARTAAEYPHLPRILAEIDRRVEVVGLEHLETIRSDGEPGILFSAHFGNWEVLALTATHLGLPLTRIYRESNNRLAEALLLRGRRAIAGPLVPKGRQGAKVAMATLAAGGHLALLVDQKMNDGIEVPFLGAPAMTAPAIAALALRFRCPLLPARCERLGGAHFRVIVEPPFRLETTGDHQADLQAGLARVNAHIAGWIAARPDHWLWLHRRWKD